MQHWDELNLGSFNGPLDLLLNLIREKKMALKDISVMAVTDQYLAYLQSQTALDIEIASEYLTMAAQLIEMKSLSLLPETTKSLREEIYFDLVGQLNQYDQFKKIATLLADKQITYWETFSKPATKLLGQNKLGTITTVSHEADLDIDLGDLDLEDFANIYRRLLSQQPNVDLALEDISELDDQVVNFIETQTISPQEISKLILTSMSTDKLKAWRLEDLIPGEIVNLKNLVSTFLAVLDLVRYQFTRITQQDETLWVRLTQTAIRDENLLARLEMISHETQTNDSYE
ncbi:condensin subunit ScpA [Entomoplasma freundtii]|uniref:Segregation and condensation protein A n=1 Tax=Entomoplasma freundtii TaxID=74700 RepID=A0A2K8NRS8_9MOLU|nr:segregation/condensation protein A [Entomoplasma freundtii]ATZ16540.1 segregation and condensation protein A [Entomoplasma freundtii]TDY58294.1 condensin subunit ScpA [Entomoplasma freundtii]